MFRRFFYPESSATLERQIMIWSLLLIVLPGLLLSGVFFLLEFREEQEKHLAALKQVVEMEHQTVESWYNHRQAELKLLAGSSPLSPLDRKGASVEFRVIQAAAALSAVGYVDENGELQVIVQDASRQLTFRPALLVDIARSTSSRAVALPKMESSPVVLFIEPVHDDSGKRRGAVFALSGMEPVARLLKEAGLGKSGETYLIDNNGVMLAWSRLDDRASSNLERHTSRAASFPVMAALREGAGSARYTNYRGEAVLGGFQRLTLPGWTIVTEMAEEELWEPLLEFLAVAGVALVFSLVLALPPLIAITGRIRRPITTLVNQARRLKEGNYDAEIDDELFIASPVEVRELCQTYNQMARAVKANVQLLEDSYRSLAETEAKYRGLVENALVGIYVVANGRIEYANFALARIFGYTEEEICGKDVQGLVDLEDWPLASRYFGLEAEENSLDFGNTFRVVRKDGNIASVEAFATKRWFTAGAVVLGVIVDVTERVKAEGALRVSERRFRTMADNAPALLWMTGPNSEGVFFNQPWLEFRGRSMDQETGTGWLEGVHLEDVSRCLKAYQVSFASKEKFSFEFRLLRNDGEYRWIVNNGVPLFSDGGTFQSYLVSGVDITERKWAEEALRRTSEDLEVMVSARTSELAQANRELAAEIADRTRAEDRYRALFNSGQDAIYVYPVEDGKPGCFLEVNEVACRMLGYSREELLQLTPLSLRSPNEAEEVLTLLSRVFETGQFRWEGYSLAKSGRKVPVEVNASLFELDGKPLVLAISRDVSERRVAEAEMLAAREALARAERLGMLGVMVAEIAHEINQPLNSIKVTADAALYWYKTGNKLDEEEMIDSFTTISAQAGRTSQIVKDIRASLRGDAAEYPLESTDLLEVLDKALSLVEHDLSGAGISVKKHFPALRPKVLGRATQLEQVMVNLLTNAIQALKTVPDREKVINVSCSVGEKVILEVGDNGPGIPKGAVEDVFEPFFTTKPAIEGMGLGLAVVRSTMESCGGKIAITRNGPDGVTFHLEFPVL